MCNVRVCHSVVQTDVTETEVDGHIDPLCGGDIIVSDVADGVVTL